MFPLANHSSLVVTILKFYVSVVDLRHTHLHYIQRYISITYIYICIKIKKIILTINDILKH